MLIKKYLAEKLQTRWPYKKLSINFQRLGLVDFPPMVVNLEESIYRLHWSELVQDLEQMQRLEDEEISGKGGQHSSWPSHDKCRHCEAIISRMHPDQNNQLEEFSLIA